MLTDSVGSDATGWRLRAGWVLAIVVLAACAFWFRVGGAFDVVFESKGSPRLLGTDAYDHLRRAAELTGTLSAEIAPRPVSAADAVGPGLFDGALALPGLAIGGLPPSLEELMTGAAWIPPLLAALSVLALFALARRFLPPVDAWITALVYVLYPGESLVRTSLGFADHHAAEIALTLAALWALTRHLQAPRARPWWQPAGVTAAPAAALLLVWRGAALTLGLMVLGLCVLTLVELTAGRDVRPLTLRFWRYGLGLLLLLALVAIWQPAAQLDAVTVRRSWLAVAAFLVLPAVAWLLRAAGGGRLGWKGSWLAAAGLALAAIEVLAAPPGQRLLAALTTSRLATVREHQAIGVSLLATLGATAWYAAPGLVVGCVAALRRRVDSVLIVPLFVACGWSILWWRLHDVGYLPPALLPLTAGCFLWAVRRFLVAHAERSVRPSALAWARALGLIPIAVLVLAPLWPYRLAPAPTISAADAEALVVYRPAAFQAARWLRDHSPAGGDHAVASPWVLGNLVATVGERRPLWARMPARAAAEWLLAGSEERSLGILERAAAGDAVRYAVIDGRSCGDFFVAEARNAGVELRPVSFGALEAGSALPLLRFDAAYDSSLAARLCFADAGELSRYRLLWESAGRVLTVYKMRLRGGGRRPAPLLSLETWPLDEGVPPPLADEVAWADDGRAVVYAARVHAEVRIFEILEAARRRAATQPAS